MRKLKPWEDGCIAVMGMCLGIFLTFRTFILLDEHNGLTTEAAFCAIIAAGCYLLAINLMNELD